MAVPLKLEKALIKKVPRGGGAGGMLGDLGVESIATSAATDLVGVDGMLPTQWDDTEMHFKFNPTELSENASAQVRTEPSRSREASPQQQYIGVNSRTLSFTVFLDEWEAPAGKDVSDMVRKLANWTAPEAQAEGPPQPPKAMFVWGKFQFEGIIKSVNARYTLFRRDGTPARGEVQVQMQQETERPMGQNPTSGGPPGRRTRQFIEGDNLQTIAYREYADPQLWRAIAEANDIDDPLSVPVGTYLLIPTKTAARARS